MGPVGEVEWEEGGSRRGIEGGFALAEGGVVETTGEVDGEVGGGVGGWVAVVMVKVASSPHHLGAAPSPSSWWRVDCSSCVAAPLPLPLPTTPAG